MELPHVVIFPYDEHGHATPAFALGRALARTGQMRVTLVLTASRYANCMRTPCENGLFSIDTLDVAGDGKQDDVCFHHSLQKLEPALESLLLRMRPQPSCLISDLLYPWSHDLADRLRLLCFSLCVHPAIIVLLAFHLPLLISKGLLPFQPGMEDQLIDFIPGLPQEFCLADVAVDFLGRDRKELEVIWRIQRSLKRAAGIVINSTYELESDVMDALSAEGFSIYGVGPISSMASNMPYLITEDEGCLQWLDDQPRGAVVYVALGSIVSLTEEEVQEVALGLEACGQPFLWVLRYPHSGSIEQLSALIAGFEERTKERGRVIRWAPQAAVLEHAAVGCFLSHCGMGSVMEALWAGVPIIGGFCKVSDQNTTCRLVTKEWGVGMVLQDCSVEQRPPLRCAVEACVKEVIHGERGRALSQKAGQLKDVMRKVVEPASGSSYVSLSKLVDALLRSNVQTQAKA